MSNFQLIMQQQKKSIKAYGVMCLVLIVLIGSYTYLQFDKFETYKDALAANEANKELTQELVNNTKNSYLEEKPKFTQLQKDMEDTLKEVFPLQDNYTELTRSFDTFEQQTHRADSPFLISNIDYQDVQESTDGQYKYLPLRMTITSSKENFLKFLHYIETSGSLSAKIRLMDVQSIRLNFNSDKDSKVQTINFSVSIRAYFQNI